MSKYADSQQFDARLDVAHVVGRLAISVRRTLGFLPTRIQRRELRAYLSSSTA